MDFLKDLNEKQLEAVTAPPGPVLVLAGAGSGKTRALTYRVAYLIKAGHLLPNQILAVTFTNKAADEMKERVKKILAEEEDNPLSKSEPAVGTFHSICVRILRREINRLKPFTSSFTIFDTDDSLRAIKQIIKSLDWDREIKPTFARSIISSIKNGQIDLNLVEHEDFIKIYNSYQKLLEEVNALDFDDLLLKTVELFQKHPKVLAKYRKMWPYILVDEYQDTNNVQYELVKMLAGEEQNVFAVGDDAQSIYGFRGANFKNILDFERDFPKALVFTLDRNYRSTKNILSAANEVIKLSKAQKEKSLWTENPEGHPIIHHTAVDETAEAMFVAGEIFKHVGEYQDEEEDDEVVYDFSGDDPWQDEEEDETPFFDMLMQGSFRNSAPNRGYGRKSMPSFNSPDSLDMSKLNNIAVLYRTNAQSRALEEVFLQFGIPYHLVGSVRFYERMEIKDILSFLRLVLNPRDAISLSRAIKIPPRGIGEKSFALINKGEYEKLRSQAKNSWERFNQKMDSIRKTDGDRKLTDIVDLVIKKFDLEEYYRDGSQEGENRWENIKELYTVASRWDDNPWQVSLAEFLEEIALYSETDEVGSQAGVTLMTLHQAKGLEFNTVFMVGMEEGLLPHSRSLEPGADVNEEIRLAYVGFTRAKKSLYLLNAFTRRIWGQSLSLKPSRVLKAVPGELIEKRG